MSQFNVFDLLEDYKIIERKVPNLAINKIDNSPVVVTNKVTSLKIFHNEQLSKNAFNTLTTSSDGLQSIEKSMEIVNKHRKKFENKKMLLYYMLPCGNNNVSYSHLDSQQERNDTIH